MFLHQEEKNKHNEMTIAFIAKMAMLVMINLRNKDADVSMLPIPKDLDSINRQNEILFSVINNIIKNELKLDSIEEGKELRFAESSYLNDVDAIKVINSNIDNSQISSILADKLLNDISFAKNHVKKAIQDLANNVAIAKAKYETGKSKSTFTLIPVSIPKVIEYFYLKGDFNNLEGNPINIPNRTGNANEYLSFDEITEKDLKNQLLSFYDYNKNEVYEFLQNFREGEIISIIRSYLSVLNNTNENLMYLNANATQQHSKIYLTYLVANMLSENDYPDNKVLQLIRDNLKVIIARAYKLVKNYISKNIVTTYVDNDKIYIIEDILLNNEIDSVVIVGGVVNAKVNGGVGTVIIDLDTLNQNSETFKDEYAKAKIAKELELSTSMKDTMINIFALESKALIETLSDVEVSKLAILAEVTNYVSGLSFKDTVDIESVSQQIILNHVYTSEPIKKFVEYFNMYSIINTSLTPADCALLAGASLVVLELGSNLRIE